MAVFKDPSRTFLLFNTNSISSSTQFLLSLSSILTQNKETMKSDREKEKEKENDHCISSHMQTLHRRLLHALNLGTRSQLAPPSHPVTSLQVLIP